jgi:sugar phosphate permease
MSAVSHARQEESGLASGIVNTSYQIGSALGLVVMVAVSAAQTLQAESGGIGALDALNTGFHTAFIGAAIVAAVAVVVAFATIKKSSVSNQKEATSTVG